jgi:hypothetical protein
MAKTSLTQFDVASFMLRPEYDVCSTKSKTLLYLDIIWLIFLIHLPGSIAIAYFLFCYR